jgi:hypothetical protein
MKQHIDTTEAAQMGIAYLMEGETIIATGSYELCEAVRDGTLDDYIEERRREREAQGIRDRAARKAKPKTARKKRRAV